MALSLPILGPAAANVLFGLAASLAWGCGDFAGGLASRRSTVFGVVLIVQATGVVVALLLVAGRGEPIPAPSTVLLAIGAGLAGTIGILGLYQGLAVGRMGVVAPVTAVIGAALPVLVGFLLEGLPGPLVIAGIALGLLSVLLVSRVPGESGGRSGIELAIAAGLAIAVFSVLVSRLPAGQVFGPTAIMRAVTTLLVIGIIALGRRPARLPGRLALAAVGVGVLDLTGNVCYILATQAGRLDIAVLLASLYPVVTVILAVALLHERVSRTHALGIAMAAVAIGCIAAG